MILRDVDDIKVGSTSVNKVYQGGYKVYDKNKVALEGYCKQNTTTGKNLLDYITNLIPTGNGLENTINEDGSITTTGIPLSSYSQIVKVIDVTDFLEDGEIYSISQLNPNSLLYIQIRILDKERNETYLTCATSQSKSFTVDKTNNISYKISVQTSSLFNWGEESKSITNFYQLEKGTATEFEPYTGGIPSPNPDYPQEIEVMEGRQVINVKGQDYTVDLKSKNKLDLTDGTYTKGNMTINVEDGIIKFNGTTNNIITEFYIPLKKPITLENGETTTFSIEVNGTYQRDKMSGRLKQSNNNSSSSWGDTYIPFNQNKNSKTYTQTEQITLNFVYIFFAPNTDLSVELAYQLEEGSTATDYEPYYNYKLAGIGEYKDNIYTKEGKWYVKSLMGKVVLDGSEIWGVTDSGMATQMFVTTIEKTMGERSTIPIYSNMYKYVFWNDSPWNTNNSISYYSTDKIRIKDTRYTTVTDFKTWLSTHNTIVYYALATSTEEEITSPTLIQQLNRLYQAM